jgi:Uma2 family endonuclease
MALARRDARYHTYGDYLTWPDDIRCELVDGVAYMMSPSPNRVHQEITGEIYFQARSALEGSRCRAYIAPFDVRLPKGTEADDKVDTVVQPDVLVICDESKLDDRGARGAPDWVVEVLSPATAAHDQTVKLAAYERAGVPEVWFVHPTDVVVTVYRLAGATYGRPSINTMQGELAVAARPEIRIDWERLRARTGLGSTQLQP